MPRNVKCSFCGEDVEPGTGITYIANDGNVSNFCGSKCSKNFKLNRVAIRVRWTKKFRRFREETLGTRTVKAEKEKKAAPAPPKEEKKPKEKKAKKVSKRKLRKKEARKKKK